MPAGTALLRHYSSPDRHKIVIPAQAGTHSSASETVEKWIPACAGMTIQFDRFLGLALGKGRSLF
jgi:hypothetical protein